MIPPERIAWVAGLVEGEGWFGIRGGTRPVLQVISTDEDVVLRLREWTGVGTVSARPLRPCRKQAWRWDVTRRDDAGRLMELLLPFLLERRAARVREIVALWKAAPPKRGTSPTCGYGHALNGANLDLRDGRRRCRKCCTRRQREYRARRNGANKIAAI